MVEAETQCSLAPRRSCAVCYGAVPQWQLVGFMPTDGGRPCHFFCTDCVATIQKAGVFTRCPMCRRNVWSDRVQRLEDGLPPETLEDCDPSDVMSRFVGLSIQRDRAICEAADLGVRMAHLFWNEMLGSKVARDCNRNLALARRVWRWRSERRKQTLDKVFDAWRDQFNCRVSHFKVLTTNVSSAYEWATGAVFGGYAAWYEGKCPRHCVLLWVPRRHNASLDSLLVVKAFYAGMTQTSQLLLPDLVSERQTNCVAKMRHCCMLRPLPVQELMD